MHRLLTVPLLLILSAVRLPAQGEPEEVQRARKVVQEYEQSERMRAAVELISAVDTIKDHESGRKNASPQELAAAREILKKREERQAAAQKQAIEDMPTLVVIRRDSRFDIGRIFNVANRDVIRRRIEEAKADIQRNEERFTRRSREALPRLERALQELKETGRPLGGMYATLFEADDKFVVAYFDSMSVDHFVALVRKSDYSPLPTAEARTWMASNLTQMEVIVE